MSEQVNHPSHYNQGRFEVIEVIEDQKLDFHLGNAIKYICRAGKKNPDKLVEDLKKAIWYLNRKLETLKPQEEIRRPNDMNLKESEKSVSTPAPKSEVDIMDALAGYKSRYDLAQKIQQVFELKSRSIMVPSPHGVLEATLKDVLNL